MVEQALAGVKVLDVSTIAAVPMAARLLGDWGADVIHIEHPVTGDPWRNWLTMGGMDLPPEVSYHFWEHYNRNKRSITLDLSREGGQEIIYKLLAKADVFLTNLRLSDLEKFSLEYDTLSQLNPGLIYGSLTGLGNKGPEKNAPAHDTVMFWARSGILHQLQEDGMPPPAPGYRTMACGDKLTALGLACGVILALLVREKTGIGQEVDISLLHTGIFALLPAVMALGPVEQAFGTYEEFEKAVRHSREEMSPLVISYQTKDGRWLQLSMAPSDPYWSRFCQAIERRELEHDPRFESVEARTENQTALFQILEEVFLSKTLEEWKPRLTKASLLWAPIQNSREVTNDPQARENDVFVSYDHPTYGRIEVVSNPIKLSKTPATIRTPAPEFSQHTEEVLLELGYTWEDIAQLKERDTIA